VGRVVGIALSRPVAAHPKEPGRNNNPLPRPCHHAGDRTSINVMVPGIVEPTREGPGIRPLRAWAANGCRQVSTKRTSTHAGSRRSPETVGAGAGLSSGNTATEPRAIPRPFVVLVFWQSGGLAPSFGHETGTVDGLLFLSIFAWLGKEGRGSPLPSWLSGLSCAPWPIPLAHSPLPSGAKARDGDTPSLAA
jgi:hypothetical protein